MTSSTTIFRQLFVISLLIITFTTTAMHESQLQLQNPTPQDELTVFDCSFMISAIVWQPVTYAWQRTHNEILKRHHLLSKITDPVITLNINNGPEGYPLFILLPLKNCINLNDESSLQIYDSGKSARYVGKPLLINGKCKKNPDLLGNNFCEQINNAENKFYQSPMPLYVDLRTDLLTIQQLENTRINNGFNPTLQEFENAGIIISTTTDREVRRPIFWNNRYNTGQWSTTIEQQITLSPGPNSIKNRKDLIQSIIDEELPKKNVFLSLMNREYDNKFKKNKTR